MIDIRCPNCNKKLLEIPNTNQILVTICAICHCRYNYKYGIYKSEAPTDLGKRMKYDKYGN